MGFIPARLSYQDNRVILLKARTISYFAISCSALKL